MQKEKKREHTSSQLMTRWGVGPLFAGISLIFSAVMISINRYFYPLFKIKFIPQIFLTIFGVILIAAGLTIFFISYFIIDRAYKERRFIQTGVYTWCRHPLYASWVIFTVPGIVLIVNSWLGLTIPIIMYILARILVVKEERYMEEQFGEQYRQYKQHVPCIFPVEIFLKITRLISKILAKIETGFLILLLTSMILIAFLQVILRNFFETSILWGDTLLRHLVLWVGFIGASLATRDDRHIKIDVLSRLLSLRWKIIIQIITHLFAAIVCYFLYRASLTFISFEKEGGSTLFANIPTWIFQLILVIGFGLIGFRFFLRALEEAMLLFSPQSTEEDKE